jgi:predicted ATPase/uncharacterized protein HemY/DNA-binding XRE family transcriptional regulator
MSAGAASPFGDLLKRHRGHAGLTQEELAEAARLSVRSLSDLERGISTVPRVTTVQLLADALGLEGAERAAFERAARRQGAPAHHAESDAAATNVPLALTSFIGREREQREMVALLEGTRLVTLTGTGGVGKTRLGLQVAGALLASYPDGVWLVELASLSSPELVPQAVATAMGVREEPGHPLLATLVAYLRPKALLLVLDNCEHLVGACAALATALLQACGGLRVLATSREGLGVAGERLYRVPPLAAPPLEHLPPLEQLDKYPAVALFVTRAQERQVDFVLTGVNAREVVQVCARLDGLPLAIELAAARVAVLAVEQIALRLDDRFALLSGGNRTALPRQQTLRATLEWSYHLLTAAERVLLGRLAVFVGGWTLEAAEAVCAWPKPAQRAVLERLGGLVHKSLVQMEEVDGAARYRLLETVREYGLEQLAAARAEAAVRDRHLAWCMALAEEAEAQLTGSEQGRWLDRLEAEPDNLRAALQWARQTGAIERGLRLAGALWRFWQARGYMSEGRQWLEHLTARSESTGASIAAPVQAKAYAGAGALARMQGDYPCATALCERSLQLRRDSGDSEGIATSLNSMGLVAYQQAAYTQAAAFYEESLALYRDLGDRVGIANVLNNLGMVADAQGSYEQAISCYETSLALFRDLGNRRNCANVLNNLGGVLLGQGAYAGALSLFEESLALFGALEDRGGKALVLEHLGEAATRQGQMQQATTYHQQSLILARDVGDREIIAWNLQDLAVAMIRWQHSTAPDEGPSPTHAAVEYTIPTPGGWLQRAVQLFSAAAGLRAALGAPLPPAEQPWYDRLIVDVRRVLGEDAFTSAWASGEALQLDQAIALALEAIP